MPNTRTTKPRTTKPLITDLDDVGLQWLPGFRAAMETRLGRRLPEIPDNWNLGHWLGVESATPYILEFNSSPAFGQLEAFACARAVYQAAAEAGIPLMAITACSEDRESHRLRIANVEAAFGPIFDDIRFVPLGGTKRAELIAVAEHYGQPGVWTEDNYQHACDGADLGYDAFVIRRPHNTAFEAPNAHPKLRWVDDYYPVGAHLGLDVPRP